MLLLQIFFQRAITSYKVKTFIWQDSCVYKFVELILEDGSKLPARFMFDPTDHELVYY